MKRRTVHKITPAKQSTFDQQFWPVLVALTVLCSIAVGAAVTLLRGPWMWGSLFVLPLVAAGSILFLISLDSQKLRRSLQLAIVVSLAIHLLVMVFASVTNIFQNPYKPNERKVAQRPIRTIEISDQRAAFVWEEANSRETPEPDVVPDKVQRPTTTVVKPQTVPVKESQPNIDPQLVKRETPIQSVPRQNPELSQLRKQTRPAVQPQSSEKITEQKTTRQTKPSPTKPEKPVESSKAADSVSRQPVAKTETRVEPASANAAKDNPTEITRSSSSPRRTQPTKSPSISAPKASSSQARVRRDTPLIPIATKKSMAAEKVTSAATSKRVKAEASKSANQITRRPTQSTTVTPATTNQPKTVLNPQSQIARTLNRRKPTAAQPTISTETSVNRTPRRATTDAKIAVSPIPVEKPSRSPESKTASRALNSKTLSVSRSTQGVAGVGRSKNLHRDVGGMNSPAARASDSARRERSLSNMSADRMLSASQKSQVQRTIGATRIPTSAFKAETSKAAKVAGAKTTGERTMESSAAKIDARAASARDEVSAERGSAEVDLGPTKIVMDRQSQRRSGGGQPEVSQLSPDATQRSKDRSNAQPSLVAELSPSVMAPRSQSATAPSTEASEASDSASLAARTGGKAAVMAERWAADLKGEFSNRGESNLAEQLSENRQRANRNEAVTRWNTDQEEDEDEENQRGTRRTRVAQAPIIRSDPGFGTAEADGISKAAPADAGESPTESLTVKVQRQASAALPGSGIGQTATNALLQAATSLPIIESKTGRRTGSGKATNVDSEFATGLAANPQTRGSRSAQPDVKTALSGVSKIQPTPTSEKSSVDGSAGKRGQSDASDVSIARAELEPSEQLQGSVLDIEAIEGAAGLGIRPDEFAGIPNRPASKDSKQLQPDLDNRFINKKFGGAPSINPDAVIAQKAFRNRTPSSIAGAAEPTTEAAIQSGLEFLARYQSADGSWALKGFDPDAPQHLTQLSSDTAATGLALLAFQGAGYNHREFKYARQVDHALQWLIENQSADGGLYVSSDDKSNNACRLYSHGIAALALTEAYGMTQDARLKTAAQKALDYIAATQDGRKGGWRYFDTPGKKSADTSVSGWMMMALQSGRLAGLTIDERCFDGIDNWLDVAVAPDNQALFRYNPYAKDSKGVSRIQGRQPSASMTAVGLLMRIYSGWGKQDPRLLVGADYLLKSQLPTDATPRGRDTYYWYYATQVLKHVGGTRWEQWNNQLRPLLIRSQEKSGDYAGSWHPYKPVPDRWGAFGGRIYVTTMNLLSLEVRHRMLPIYQRPNKPAAAAVIK